MSSYTSTRNRNCHKKVIYSNLKIFHYMDKIDSLSPSVDRVMNPIHIRIKPTNICNHNCRYCAYRVDGLQLGKDMNRRDQIPREKVMEILDDIVEMGVKSVTFSGGGEPLCYPHLTEAINRLRSSSVKFAALTNGSLLDGDLAAIFARYGTWLRVSMDGWDEESYSGYRGVDRREFAKVMSNIERFKKLGGKCILGVSIIVDRVNAAHIYQFVKRLKDIGIDNVKISPCIVSNDGAENNLYHSSIFDTVKEAIGRMVNDFADDGFEINDSYHTLEERFNKEYSWCPYLQILPVIGADLNIYPCQDKAYNLKDGLIGSIKERRFKDFWFLDKSKFFKIDPRAACNHHCVANVKNKLVLEYLEQDREHLEFV
ncbi:MAG: radical SAM protein [Candidatus Omnitrophota bacterium]